MQVVVAKLVGYFCGQVFRIQALLKNDMLLFLHYLGTYTVPKNALNNVYLNF